MRMLRRLVRDESGMTMGLAIIMIVLLGVMGAGLLTFVTRDMNTVLEENRGQRAFEVADAGVEAAKVQLTSDVVREHYNDVVNPPDPPTVVGEEDIQWSKAKGGLTLQDLDGDGVAGTLDNATVTIEYLGEAADEFRVISEGTYGDAKRRIEAIFEGDDLGAGTGYDIGHPIYYTPSSISIDGPGVNMDAISMFAGKDILIEGVANTTDAATNSASFVTEYGNNGGTFQGFTGKKDKLCDWNSDDPLDGAASPIEGCYVDSEGPYNDRGRTITTGPSNNRRTDPFTQPGFAAEGKICGYPTGVPTGTCTSASAADGVYGYDSTTGTKVGGNLLKFEAKTCTPTCAANAENTISYPFPIPRPSPEGLKEAACSPPGTVLACPEEAKTPPPISYFTGTPADPSWGLNTSNASSSRVAFIDAQNQTLTFNPPGGSLYKGILVVWCGRLVMKQPFEGIILNLTSETNGDLSGNTSCTRNTPTKTGLLPDGKSAGTYENFNDVLCACWVYAAGGTDTLAGIQIDPGSTLKFRPGQEADFEDNLFEAPPTTNFGLKSWRELYE